MQSKLESSCSVLCRHALLRSYLGDAAIFPPDRDDLLATNTLVEEAHGAHSWGMDLERLERGASAGGGVPVSVIRQRQSKRTQLLH